MFIKIEFVRSKNIWAHWLPRAIPFYNVDRTPNEARHITKVIDLIVQYKDHSKWATFHVTNIGQTMVILGNTWLMENNPEIDWHTGDISMMRCPASCRSKAKEEKDQKNCVLANKTWRQLKAHLHRQVHIEEVPESQSAHIRTKPSPGFAC